MKLIVVDNCSHKNISQASDTPAKLIKETKSLVRGFSYNNVGKTNTFFQQLNISKHAEIISAFKRNDKTDKSNNRLVRALCNLGKCFYNSNKIIGRYEWHFKISLSAALLTNPSEPLIVLNMSY